MSAIGKLFLHAWPKHSLAVEATWMVATYCALITCCTNLQFDHVMAIAVQQKADS